MNRVLTVCALAVAAARPAAGQVPSVLPAGSYVIDRWYPKLFWTPREGFIAGGYFSLVAPLRRGQYDAAAPLRGALTLDGQAATSGSRFVRLDGWAPYLWPGWRLRLTLSAARWNRDPFYGVGNDTPFEPANQDVDAFFYRARRNRLWGRAEIQRRVAGGLRVLAGAHLERWHLNPLSPTSVLGQAGPVGPATELALRAGLVFDTRDDEAVPRRGVLVEFVHAVADAELVGDGTWTRTLASARAYLPLSGQWNVAARLAGQHMGGTPSLGSLYLIDQSDWPREGLGGPHTHRGLSRQRLLGRDKVWGNLDVQFTPFEVPTLIRVALVGFVDAARVFAGEDLRLTTEGLHVGGGFGLMISAFRNAVLGLTLAGGPDGAILHAYTSWPY